MAVILLDAMADALCIAMALRIAGRRISLQRVSAAAAMGAMLACGVRQLDFLRGGMAVCWLITAMLMDWAASGGFSPRMALLLMACEGFLGGTIYALKQAMGSRAAAWSMGAAFALMMSAAALRARQAASDVRRVRIRITCACGEAAFDALVDSGNCLRDYLTHRPVIVLPDAARARLGLADAPLRPIFADTAGGRQMMACFTPSCVWIDENGQRTAVSTCAAFSPGLPASAPALVPQSLLAQNEDESRVNREGNAYGEAESAAARNLGDGGDATGAVHHQAGGNSGVYRRERFTACAADEGRGNHALCAHGGGPGRRQKDTHRAQPEARGVHRPQV